MNLLPGVFVAKKKDGSTYYRSSITFRNKHISIGSYSTNEQAHQAYIEANTILTDSSIYIEDYDTSTPLLTLSKWIVLVNFRDNNIYFKNPIYIKEKYFLYYLDGKTILKFDVDDLFYYSNHKIQKRGGHLFVSDYGMQVSILSRYGIKNYAVLERDYQFANGDPTDFRYGNVQIINRYHGVNRIQHKGTFIYVAKIHLNGDYIIGKYKKEEEAAVAYNKAVHILQSKGFDKNFPTNYITEIDEIEYAKIYNMVKISKKIREYLPIF
ncbi:hypothetical protein [Anaeromicropila herbilytica]|uniref:AP2/ERF domain-containing protein n=1 Tax=Anaeromicropila herbilytica TaxID=2785025 RepID=A0A7R7ENJ9_9FIRM|nr:hypothetical protein [Anaeromicropila herbilytica]BCN32230.1 hypothetical protein bsdtb5_35250 [Anaeromicropila herbilytica]